MLPGLTPKPARLVVRTGLPGGGGPLGFKVLGLAAKALKADAKALEAELSLARDFQEEEALWVISLRVLWYRA